MPKFSLLLALGLLVYSLPIAQAKETPMTETVKPALAWYGGGPCTKAVIKNYRTLGSQEPYETATVTDTRILAEIAVLLDQLPTEGEIYVKFAPDAPHLSLELTCNDEAFKIDFINEQIKTPATTFYATSQPRQADLYNLLERQLGFEWFGWLKRSIRKLSN